MRSSAVVAADFQLKILAHGPAFPNARGSRILLFPRRSFPCLSRG
jgi:hypothetical protein